MNCKINTVQMTEQLIKLYSMIRLMSKKGVTFFLFDDSYHFTSPTDHYLINSQSDSFYLFSFFIFELNTYNQAAVSS